MHLLTSGGFLASWLAGWLARMLTGYTSGVVGLLDRLEFSILADLEASRLAGCLMQWMVDGGWMMEDGCE